MIGFVTTSIEPSDGWGRYSYGVVKTFAESNPCVVITNSKDRIDSSLNCKVLPINFLGLNAFATLRGFSKARKAFAKCELVHGLNEKTIGLLLFLKLTTRKRIYLTLHGTYSQINFGNPIVACVKLFTYFRVDGLTSGSQHTVNSLPFRALRKKVTLIPNGVDTKIFTPSQSNNPRDFFLFVGALKSRKGPDILIEAFAKSGISSRLVLVGDQSNRKFLDSLVTRISQLGIEELVEFRESIDDNELLDLYQNAISLVLPARITEDSFEGFPMVIFEANASGTPVITTRGFGADYAILEEANGFLIDQESSEQLSQALNKAHTFNYYSGMRDSCLKVASDHDWKKIRVRLWDFYR
jgi:glycosyltransferase involved in cell wall biosynthesis